MKTPEYDYFHDSEKAAACLKTIRSHCGEAFLTTVQETAGQSADPLGVLINLTRFLEAVEDRQAEALRMSDIPGYLPLLAELFSQGPLLSDMLCRYPQYGAWLWDNLHPDHARPPMEYGEILEAAFQKHNDIETRQKWLRQFSHRELLRIAAREVHLHAPFESVSADISHLADAMIEGALRASTEYLSPRFSPLDADEAPSMEVTFCVLAMGKLGGQELNFSSDIDLLFIYSASGHTREDSPQSATTEEYYRKLCELMIQLLSERTAEGHVFRVDTRLRPFGKSGPLACSLGSAVDYYSTYGRAWERQALIKARPCAGDFQLGEVLLEQLRPFFYPRYFDDTTLEDIRSVKRQVESIIASKSQTDREVKLGRGGIRDIEFTVQMLQMLHGGRWPEIRTSNTLEALRALGQRQKVQPFDAATLERNYIFLRGIEHRLQIEGGRQTHILPETGPELDMLARRLGYENGDSLMNVYRERTAETRAILEQFLATRGDGNLWVIELLEPESACADGLKKLASLGFRDPGRARNELLLLANGPDDAPYTRETAQQFSAVTPFLLEALGQTPDPDGALLRFSQILGRLPVPATLYNLLKYHRNLSRYLIALVSNSDYLSEMLLRDISLLDLIGTPGHIDMPSRRDELEQVLSDLEAAADPAPALYRLRDGEVLKVALREILLGIPVTAVGDELSQLAEVILARSLSRARARTTARYGTTSAAFAIVALGKFGGRELGYGSDLDLVFVHEDEETARFDISTSPTEYFASIASQVIKSLKEPTRYGLLYDVDARLRPDGNKGALAIPEQRFRQYYQEEAYFWEKFALMKVRAVAGDAGFAARIEAEARHLAFSMRLERSGLEELEAMRAKLAAAAPRLDLKRREGGIAEIEFATRLLQLRHAGEHPDLERGGVFGALELLSEKSLLPEQEHGMLREGYAFYRRLLNRSRMMRGCASSCLPDAPEMAARLAQSLGIEGGLQEQIESHAAGIHQVYLRIYNALRNETAPPL